MLVDCDIGGINEQKIEKLVDARDYFKSCINYGELEIVPVLFSPKNLEEGAKNKAVTIIDGYAITGILEDIAKGDLESARSKITFNSRW